MIDYARTLMMEKNAALKYWREAVSTAVYTLNRVQVKKGTNATPFELWYGHSPNVKNFKRTTYTSKEVLELVHIDLCGLSEVQIYRGDRYIILFVDDYSRMMTVMFLK